MRDDEPAAPSGVPISTREILASIGMSEPDVDALVERGVTTVSERPPRTAG